MSNGSFNPDYYTARNMRLKLALLIICLIVGLCASVISTIAVIDHISKYNDQDYLKEVLLSGKSYSSYKLIKGEIMDMIIFFGVIVAAFLPLVILSIIRLRSLFAALNCSAQFASINCPFVNVDDLAIYTMSHKRRISVMRKTLRRRYLRNCTFEMHENTLKIALAKKIVKDQCPSCGAPIVGAVDENYKCSYCGNTIIGVIEKK